MSTRPYVMSFLRGKDKTPFKPMRYYARLNTAIPRAIGLLLDEGQPGDVIELASNDFGFQVATVTVHAGGTFKVQLAPGITQPEG